jgi:hypothetical protein
MAGVAGAAMMARATGGESVMPRFRLFSESRGIMIFKSNKLSDMNCVESLKGGEKRVYLCKHRHPYCKFEELGNFFFLRL